MISIKTVCKKSQTMNLRILLIAPFPPPYGGIANWTKNLITMMNERGHEFDLVDISPKSRLVEGRSLFNRVREGVRSSIDAMLLIKGLLKKKEYTVAHMATSGSLGLFRDIVLIYFLSRKHVPIVYHAHFGRIPDIIQSASWERWLLMRCLKKTNHIIVIDELSRCSLTPIVSVPISYIGNPINTERITSICLNKKAHAKKKEVIFIGWVVETKGVKELSDAWRIVKDKFPDWTLRFVGPYKKSEVCLLIDLKLDSLELVGELSHNDAMIELSKAEVLVLPSYTEGCPNVVLEAMALGKTVVASAVGAIPDLLEHERGYLIEPKSVDDLVKNLECAMNNEKNREKMGRKAQKHVFKNYDINIVMDAYETVWNSTCKR